MLNKSIILGRLGADITVNKTQTGKSVISFQLANERPKAKGQEKAETDWINCQAWNKTAEMIALYFHKGDKILVSGRLQNRKWKDANGNDKFQTDIVVESFDSMSGSKQSSSQTTQQGEPAGASTGYYPDETNFGDDFNTGPLIDIKSDDLPF